MAKGPSRFCGWSPINDGAALLGIAADTAGVATIRQLSDGRPRSARSPSLGRFESCAASCLSRGPASMADMTVRAYAGPMTGGPDRPPLRLAELVAALSLGIDLGFGQPMEHVLRQCLIALRLAERARRSTRRRGSAVYYTALLINVGCHTDAHEQAKWFGDDIALKSIKYNDELSRVAAYGGGLAAAARRRQPAAAPLPGRARVRALGPPRHGRHDRSARPLARTLAAQLGSLGARAAKRSAPPTSSGTARVGRASWRARRCRCLRGSRSSRNTSRSRTAWAASDGGDGARPTAAGAPVRSDARRTCSCAEPAAILAGLDTWARGTPSSAPSRRSRSCSSDEQLRRGTRGHRELRRPQVAVLARPLARSRRARRRGRRAARTGARRRCARCGAPASSTTSGGSACRTRSGTRRGRSGPASGSACAATRT